MRWWRRYAGVRVQSTVAAASIVAFALLVAMLTGWWLAKRTLVHEARDAVTARSQDVAVLLQQQGTAGLEEERRPMFGEVIQVLDDAGHVLAAAPPSAAGLKLEELLPGRPSPARSIVAEVPALPQSGADEPYVLVARQSRDGATHQNVVIVVGRSVAGLAETVGVVGKLGVVGLPLLIVVTAAVTYIYTGRALAPVEEMRRRVQSITGRRLDDRVPVPAVRDEIGRLAETMNDMLATLQSAQDAQRRFVADAGHELRSPLATITTTLEVARARSDPASPAAAFLADLTGEAARMSRLVDDLLLLARADESGLRLRATDVDLDDLLETEARRLRMSGADGRAASAGARAGGVAISLRTEPVRVTGDPDRLAQVIRNLTDNARRHARSQVRLEVRLEGTRAVITVEDDGPGIAAADRERVFERFVRLDASRERASGGSGLGLAIVREIVISHGGQVSMRSSALGGAAAEVVLPASAPPTADELAGGELPRVEPPGGELIDIPLADARTADAPQPGQPPSSSSR